MQVATILPTAYLDLIKDRPYHMALAHLLGKDTDYATFYTDRAREGKFVILDNGVIETGKPMHIERVVEIACHMGAQEIILPDVIEDANATLDAACEAIEYARKHYDGKLMGVPQGETLNDWIDCARHMLELDVDTIGIPKRLTKIGGRDGRLGALFDLGWLLRGREVHLLGCWENPIECTMIARAAQTKLIVPIRGVDSAIPYVYARESMLISHGPRPSGAVDFSAHDADRDILVRNIQIWEDSAEFGVKDENGLVRLQ